MKKLSHPLLMLLLCLTTAVGHAQQKATGKFRLFADYPEKINVSENTFSTAFTGKAGNDIAVTLGEGLTFKGTVVSNEYKYSNLQTITIKSPAFDNAFLSISKIINADKTITYTGRIINTKALDGYEIKRDATGNYRFQKFEMGRILQDCSYQ